MVFDGFLDGARRMIEARGAEVAAGAEAIVIKGDGSWELADPPSTARAAPAPREAEAAKRVSTGVADVKSEESDAPVSTPLRATEPAEYITILSDGED